MNVTTVVIGESIDSCREHLEGFILKNQTDYKLLHACSNSQEVFYTSKQYQPNLIIIDVDLPGMCTLEFCREVLKHCPNTGIIMRASEDIAYHGRRMIKAGARGILAKHASNAELRHCLGWVHQGNPHLATECRHLQLRKFADERELSEFELKVLRGVCLGKTLEQIVDELYASLSTVRRAKDRISQLAGISDSAGILRWAYLQGYISLKECWGL